MISSKGSGERVRDAALAPAPLDALPLGVFRSHDGVASIGALVGDHVLDLRRAAEAGLMGPDEDVLRTSTLNAFLDQGRATWLRVLDRVAELVGQEKYEAQVAGLLHGVAQVQMLLPFTVADYVDFYASRHHAENLGQILRPGEPALKPNWLHLPVGYHGRAGTVVVSGTDVVRPSGQFLRAGGFFNDTATTEKLDIEVELGFVVGAGSARGTRVGVDDFEDHVFGVVLVNDWSARDIQAWEYVPLGPFLAKSFATSISPWVVPLRALETARVSSPPREVAPLPYLAGSKDWSLDIEFEVFLNGELISRPPASSLYWSGAHMLAHLSANGASTRAGDLFASGTISGPDAGQAGSLIELTWNGDRPLRLSDGATRAFLLDGDVVELRATAAGPGPGSRFSLGTVTGRIVAGTR